MRVTMHLSLLALPDIYGGTNPAKPDIGIWRVPL
jgi:hypothetical protein